MIRSNFEMPRVPVDYFKPPVDGARHQEQSSPNVQVASNLTYDGASNRLTLTRSDGTTQDFPANNNAQSGSRGKWEDGTYSYGYQKSHPEDAPDSGYGSYGIHVFQVPGAEGLGVHSGRENTPDKRGRSGADHATNGCIRTTDEGMAAIDQAITDGDPVATITVQNNWKN